jgi:hypothetical protein
MNKLFKYQLAVCVKSKKKLKKVFPWGKFSNKYIKKTFGPRTQKLAIPMSTKVSKVVIHTI